MNPALIDSTPVESCAGAPVLTCARKVCIYYKTATAIYFRECVGVEVAKPEGLLLERGSEPTRGSEGAL